MDEWFEPKIVIKVGAAEIIVLRIPPVLIP